MSAVWDLEQGTVADVLQELRKKRPLSRNTVHTMMSRLACKGWLSATEGVKGVFTSQAAVRKETFQQQCLDQVVETVFDG